MQIESLSNSIICHQCGLLVSVPLLQDGSSANCPRCAKVLTKRHRNAVDLVLYFSISALLCLVYSVWFGFLEMSVQGQVRQITLMESVSTLFSLQEMALGSLMSLIIIGLPALYVSLLIFLVGSIKLQRVSRSTIMILRIVGYVRFWNMCEIFFLGILVSMVKIAGLAHIEIGASFWAYALFNLFLFIAVMHFDKVQLARTIRELTLLRETSAIPLGTEASHAR
jgi:paraquat-inducible protein A